ncbi:MAG TPA: S41 family peptidase [Rubrobacteraceae bacterium]|nr:S41 family peptidase [Rubrobacteraceae bacterium]
MWNSTKNRGDRRRGLVRALAMLLVLLVATLGAYSFGRSQSPAGIGPEDREAVALYAEALDTVQDDYVDQEAVDSKKQTYAAIEGMLDSLGDEGHTRFLTPEEVKENRAGLSGTYVGIGVQLEDQDGRAVIAAPIEGSPADQAGIETGDVVVAVNGKSVRGAELSEIVDRVKGPEGTNVDLTVVRDSKEREFSLQRAEIRSPVASWEIIPGADVAQVRLSSFSNDSANELREALDEARAAGARRFVLDLRSNPGGRLDQAVEIAGLFLEPGKVIYIRQDAAGEREKVKVESGSEPIDAPLTVLVNEGSASSAEILAGALRDNDRATIIGAKTFGTGTVLSQFTLRDGSALLLGVSEWLTPDGDFIRETGIEPDLKVKLGKDGDPVTPTEARDLSRREILDRDPQLRRALEELGG